MRRYFNTFAYHILLIWIVIVVIRKSLMLKNDIKLLNSVNNWVIMKIIRLSKRESAKFYHRGIIKYLE